MERSIVRIISIVLFLSRKMLSVIQNNNNNNNSFTRYVRITKVLDFCAAHSVVHADETEW
jgi:hypothetical protein